MCIICDDFKAERAALRHGEWVWVKCDSCGAEVGPPPPNRKKEVSR